MNCKSDENSSFCFNPRDSFFFYLIHMWSFRRISLTFNSSTMTSSEWGNKSCLNNNNTPQKNVYTHMKFLPFLSLTHSLTSTSVMAVTIWNEKKILCDGNGLRNFIFKQKRLLSDMTIYNIKFKDSNLHFLIWIFHNFYYFIIITKNVNLKELKK